MKHTPGPWLFRGKSSSVHAAPANEPGEHYQYGEQIARFAEDDDGDASVSDADLALMLAAPEMLAALEKIKDDADRSLVQGWTPSVQWLSWVADTARDAIAKAKGGT